MFTLYEKISIGVLVLLFIGAGFFLFQVEGEDVGQSLEKIEKPQKATLNSGPITKRDWNSYTSKEDDVATTEFYGKWVNYLSDTGWQDINTDFSITTTGDGFEMLDAPFEVFVPLMSDGTATMHNNNRYDIWSKSEILELPFNLNITAQGVNSVQGRAVRGDLILPAGLQEDVSYVIYEGAYANADLIYYVDFGVAPRLEKLIKFHRKPSIFEYTFEMGVNELVEISRKDVQGILKPWRNKKKDFSFDGSENLSIKRNGSDVRGVGFKPFFIWDSNLEFLSTTTDPDTITPRNIQNIDIKLSVASPLSVYLTKILPEAFFDTAIYPVYTDTTTTFYPDEHAESTSVDGAVEVVNDSSGWTSIHTAATGDNANSDGTYMQINRQPGIFRKSGGIRFDVTRGFWLFDTSALPDTDTIDSATLDFYNVVDSRIEDTGYAYVALVQVTPASNTNLVTGDYDQCGDVTGPTEGSDQLNLGSIGTDAYKTFTLNATGEGWIDAEGITKLGVRTGDDMQASNPFSGAQGYNSILPRTSEASGDSQAPKLIVVHSAAGGGGGGVTPTNSFIWEE